MDHKVNWFVRARAKLNIEKWVWPGDEASLYYNVWSVTDHILVAEGSFLWAFYQSLCLRRWLVVAPQVGRRTAALARALP